MTILLFLVESVRLLLNLLLCPAKLLTPSLVLLLHLHLLLDPALVMLTQSILLPVQTKVEDGGANKSDDDTDPDMIPLIDLVADAQSLLLHLLTGQFCAIVVVDVVRTHIVLSKFADIVVFAAVDIGSNQSTDCSRGTTSAAADRVSGRVKGVVGGCIYVLPGTSAGRLERAMFRRAQIAWHGQVELRVDSVGCAFSRDIALFAYDRVYDDDDVRVCVDGSGRTQKGGK